MNQPDSSNYLDLRGTPCPVNFIRCQLAIEDLQPTQILKVDLDIGEPKEMVISGLQDLGHTVEIVYEGEAWISIHIICKRS